MGRTAMHCSFFTTVLLVTGISGTVTGGGLCGESKPDQSKTCISIRLPWKVEPIYFCTEKENLTYEKKCPEKPRCRQTTWSNRTLMIATPWDCCPLNSVPSQCEHVHCPSKPFNRTCVVLKRKHSGGCCPTYFCENDAEVQDNCNFKILEPNCHSSPAGKQHCVGFVDHFGCCTKYQCDGEGKPGKCPTHPAIPKYQTRSTATASIGSKTSNPHVQSAKIPMAKNWTSDHFSKPVETIPCIGDYNCPNDMKCCAATYGVYAMAPMSHSRDMYSKMSVDTNDNEDGDANVLPFYDANASYGYCVHPLIKETKATRSHKRPTTAATVTQVSFTRSEDDDF